jgi:hypothetical protein
VLRHAGRCGQLQQHPTIFMRWKEQFFVNTKEECGLTIAGKQQLGPRSYFWLTVLPAAKGQIMVVCPEEAQQRSCMRWGRACCSRGIARLSQTFLPLSKSCIAWQSARL